MKLRTLVPVGALMLAACSADPAAELLDDEEIETAEERDTPLLLLQTPERGAFIWQSEAVVSGTATATSAPITKVKINDEEVEFDANGFFGTKLALTPGPNIVGVRVEAEDRGRSVDATTVFSGQVNPPGALIEDAVQVHLGKEFLDDDDDDLDDISSIVALIIADEAFLGTLTAEPFQVGDDAITVNRIEVASADVDLVPKTNCMDAAITINGAEIDLGTEGIAAIFGEEVFVRADAGTVTLEICGTETPGELRVTDSSVEFTNLKLTTNEKPNLADDYPTVHDTLVDLLESAMSSWLGSSLGGFLTDLLQIFDLEYQFGDLDFSFRLVELSAHPDGLELYLDGTISSERGLPEMPEGAGSLRTDDPSLGDGFSKAPIALALSDDAMNQLLFAYWWSGSIADYELDPAALSELPEVFQPLQSFDVLLGLPPTLVPATYPEEFAYDLVAGEVGLNIQAGTDRRFETAIHLRSGANLVVDEEGLLAMKMDGRAQKITVQANVTESPSTHEPGDIAALLRLIVPTVLGSVDVNYGGFPIPDFDLSAFSENVAAFEGQTIRFVPSASLKAGEGGGYLVVEGQLE